MFECLVESLFGRSGRNTTPRYIYPVKSATFDPGENVLTLTLNLNNPRAFELVDGSLRAAQRAKIRDGMYRDPLLQRAKPGSLEDDFAFEADETCSIITITKNPQEAMQCLCGCQWINVNAKWPDKVQALIDAVSIDFKPGLISQHTVANTA